MKSLAYNKRARFDYDIRDTMIAGIILDGHEVKSIKAGHISLKGSFVSFSAHEAYLTNAHVTPYQHAQNTDGYDATRRRKLLLHRKELTKLRSELESQGMSLVPLSVGVQRGLVKLELGLGKGKKTFDKRETIKKRDMLRDAERDTKPVKRHS